VTDTAHLATSLRAELISLVNSVISLDPSQPVDGETDLLLSGLVDSLGVVELVGWLEDRLAIAVDPVDVVLENFQTVDRMVSFAVRVSSGDPSGSEDA
jgi:acyl carrier protein